MATLKRGSIALPGLGPEIAMGVLVIVWSSTFVLSKDAFREISPLAYIFFRFVLITFLGFVVLAIRARTSPDIPYWRVAREDRRRFFAVGLLGYTLYQLGFVLGLDRTSPFSSSLLVALVPLFTMLILLVRGERPTVLAWIGISIAIIGVVVFLSGKDAGGGTLLGDLISLGAGLAFAAYGVVNRPLVRSYPPETYTAYCVLAGTIPLIFITGPAALRQDWGAISGWTWVSLVYLSIFPVYIAYMFWNWAIARRGATAATSTTLLVPVASGILSVLFYGERFGPGKLVGAAIVLVGLVVLRWPRPAS